MNKKRLSQRIFSSFITLLLLAAVAASFAPYTPAQIKTTAAPAQDPLTMLPQSDAVVTADVRRILNEALPRALATDQAKMTQINIDIDRFKTRTGVDLRTIERMALGVRIREVTSGTSQTTRLETVAIARGTFRADIIVAAGRLAAKDKYRTEKYAGKNIYVFTLDEQMKLFGLFNMRLTDVAVCVMDTHTLALGQLARVREAIDASAGKPRVGADLVQLATRTPNALIGFGANVPTAVLRELGGIGLDSDEISKNIASIRQVYGAIGMSGTGFDLQAVARTENAQAAQSLNDTINGAKEFISPLVSQFMRNDAKAKLVRNALDSLRVTTAGNELQIKLEVTQSDLSTLVSGI